jgi:hypothetical protein
MRRRGLTFTLGAALFGGSQLVTWSAAFAQPSPPSAAHIETEAPSPATAAPSDPARPDVSPTHDTTTAQTTTPREEVTEPQNSATNPTSSEAPIAQSAATPEQTPDSAGQDPAALMAQLDAEMGTTSLSDAESTSKLTLYGFADVGFYKYFVHKGSPFWTLLYPNSSFAVGNLNVYMSGELGDGWRSLAEIRFTYLPNGSRRTDATGIQRTNTAVTDYTNLGRTRQTGAILIERAWIEYAMSGALTVRGGSWLTPYGIWNEDHGSPTIIPVTRPMTVGLELLPERQTGLLAFGTYYASDTLTLGYAVGLSNGRGPVQDYADLDENKAITLRLKGTHRGAGVFSFGASSYLGRYTDWEQGLVLEGGTPRVVENLTHQYDEVSFGLDARYVLGGFHAQTEFLVNDQVYTDEGRPVRIGNEFQPDHRRYGAYALLGYRFDWFGLMPFVTGEYFSLTNQLEPTRPATTDILTDFGVGLNARPTDNVTLKLEGNLGVFFVDNAAGSAFEDPVPAVQAQAAWAF